jgi:hypothetical protein
VPGPTRDSISLLAAVSMVSSKSSVYRTFVRL